MFNIFPRPESPEEQSSINFDFKASIIIKGEVLMKVMKVLPWLLGGSVFGGGLAYSIYNNLLPSNTEAGNNPSDTELVDQSSGVKLGCLKCGICPPKR